jgi:hypothetical protein
VYDAIRRTKSRINSKNKLTRADLAVGLGISVIAWLLVGFIILRINGARSIGAQRCPIDGFPAEWQAGGEHFGSRRDHNICNYGYYSKADPSPLAKNGPPLLCRN